MLHAFPDSARFGAALADRLSQRCESLEVHRFPDGESLVRAQRHPSHSAIVVRSLHAPNAKLVETLFAADALRRRGVRHLTLVAPYLPYMRQDAVFRPGEALSQQVVADLLGRTFDRVLTVEAHLHRIDSLNRVFRCDAESVSAAGAIAQWLGHRACVVVGPDGESRRWVERIAALAGCAGVVGEKRRLADRRVRVELPSLPRCRRAVIVDDIASSGATLAATARTLRKCGIARVEAVVVHAIFAPGAAERLARAGIARTVTCNSVPHPSNRIDVTAAMAAALRSRHGSGHSTRLRAAT